MVMSIWGKCLTFVNTAMQTFMVIQITLKQDAIYVSVCFRVKMIHNSNLQ